jgi:hypothetical protein
MPVKARRRAWRAAKVELGKPSQREGRAGNAEGEARLLAVQRKGEGAGAKAWAGRSAAQRERLRRERERERRARAEAVQTPLVGPGPC